MAYREWDTSVPGVVLWRSAAGSAPALILPDGCLDLIWDGRQLLVAGPDTAARWHRGLPASHYTALRFSHGLGPALLGVPADSLTDQSIALVDLWPPALAERLTQQVAVDPVGALSTWLAARAASHAETADPLGARLFPLAAAGLPVAKMADAFGLSARQLHRRCLPVFGYGPRRLARVLRLLRAVEQGRTGRPLAEVATGAGFYDQAHLSREVRALVGLTPTELLVARNPE
ncbi:MAG TPA: helix-turn-helix domain-containing protein [Kineosporiaceae bacterium]|nr:helix-turn-helix domain-containing protein [Kineosporiaceae bacterium]